MIAQAVIQQFEKVVGKSNVLSDRAELVVYECDGLTFHKSLPEAVLFVNSADEVANVIRIAHREEIPFLARGAGTGLSGGAVALEGGLIIEMARMKRLIKVDLDNRYAVVEPGLVNLELSKAISHLGYYYAPDPSSQSACTIGGNIAENAGGPHCLKYGMTTSHVLALEIALPNGDLVQLGAPFGDPLGYDLVGLFVGSEGTFGIVTKAWLRLTRMPQQVRTILAAFGSIRAAADATSRIIAAGIIPAALEIMDKVTIETVEASVYAAGFPIDAEAVLITEIDGLAAGMDVWAERIQDICRAAGAFKTRLAGDETERAQIWKGRKGAFGATGRLNANIYLADAVVPRTKLPDIISKVCEIAAQARIKVANVFHAGDGNLHPVFAYNGQDKEETERMLGACREVLRICVEAGGTITGEHGVGFEKIDFMPLIFSATDLAMMQRARSAFNPDQRLNPGKVLPTRKSCGEISELGTILRKGYDFHPV
ncbi:MAG: FAD-binding protein [Acidobacteria bacterium]|nr:FAD-binding protein [Acidobacteriota bacterium]MBI3655550.1 FAD-binding protein [Acidobacteriota bacterium]